MERVYLSREGYEKMQVELERLKNVKRREISNALEHARSLGDLKENAEYHTAKDAMSDNEKKIRELDNKLSRAEIIDDARIDSSKAYIGAKLKIVDLDNGEELNYTLVSQDEANITDGSISVVSPVGKALLGHEVGDEVEANVPAGLLKYKIIEISR
ncbi:MAG: transcription elongation factor GreA [Candidatus Omnitrophota bacterium]